MTKASLSPGRRWLLGLMQQINHGRIERIVLRRGYADLSLHPHVIREVKFCAENGPRPERGRDDYALKAQVVELFDYCDRIGDGTVPVLEVKHGLPFRMLLAENGG